MIRLRVTITLDISADGFADAAAHQQKLHEMLSHVTQVYPNARMDIRQVKTLRQGAEAAPAGGLPHSIKQIATRTASRLKYESYER